jgi:hypothetical protein
MDGIEKCILYYVEQTTERGHKHSIEGDITFDRFSNQIVDVISILQKSTQITF